MTSILIRGFEDACYIEKRPMHLSDIESPYFFSFGDQQGPASAHANQLFYLFTASNAACIIISAFNNYLYLHLA